MCARVEEDDHDGDRGKARRYSVVQQMASGGKVL